MITLVTGGIKSGKSSFALKYVLNKSYKKRAFVATGVPFDNEMSERIQKHKIERAYMFDTFEEPLNVPKLIEAIDGRYHVILFECLTTYLGNLYYYNVDVEKYISEFTKVVSNMNSDIVVVTNEVGWSIIPENELARKYTEILGKTNSKLASIAHEVYVVICGIEMKIK
ncbi:MAG: bifunctional adenosylcobinamide kinase/adenosylcobinamide-phosphate guanylyltransferase [Pseudothermotoga sp.]